MPEFYPLAYFAGLIDGDGYIGMMNISGDPRPTIALAMTHEDSVKRFADQFGITYKKINSPSMQNNVARGNKQQWVSRVSCHQAYEVIKKIQPWLLEKADVALECCAYYEGRVCEQCGGDVPPDRPGKASKYCSHKCYKTADRRRRSATKKGLIHEPILAKKDIVKPERKFSCEDEHLSYLAGLCDAEGHFGIHTSRDEIRPLFQLKMTHEGCVKELAEFFGYPYKKLEAPSHVKDQEEKGHAQAYTIHINNRQALDVSIKLLPFLYTKKNNADMIKRFYA